MDLITKSLLNVLYGKPYKIPADIELPVTVLAKYTGAFSFKPSFTLYVTIEDGKLAAQPSKQPKTVLLAEKENYFFVEEANCFVEFIKDEQGNYNEAVLRPGQGGEPKKGPRIYPAWGLAGTATAKGWEESVPDIQLIEDSVTKGQWVIKGIALKEGLMVFRLNNDWGYHYGDDGNDGSLDMFGPDIKVKAGTYDIVLDLTDAMEPKYTIVPAR